MAKHTSLVLDNLKTTVGSRKVQYAYKPNKTFDHRISADARLQTKKNFAIVQAELGNTVLDVNVLTRDLLKVAATMLGELEFDADKATKIMIQVVDDSGIRYGINKFMGTVF